MFLYGMNLMSSGLQKAAGERMRSFLSAMTSNPLKGVLTGLGITSVIQSSSATTVMVVSFVNAGLLTLAQAIGVIMGANIGTTVTAWLVSWLGFKADISILAVPLMAVGFLLSNSKRNQRRNISELIVGFCLLFLGLSFMKESVPDLGETPEVLAFVQSWSAHGFGSVLIFLAFGTVLTLILQPLTCSFLNGKQTIVELCSLTDVGQRIGGVVAIGVVHHDGADAPRAFVVACLHLTDASACLLVVELHLHDVAIVQLVYIHLCHILLGFVIVARHGSQQHDAHHLGSAALGAHHAALTLGHHHHLHVVDDKAVACRLIIVD